MEYIPVLIMMLAGATIGLVVLVLTHLLGPNRAPHKMKNIPFECGMPAVGSTRQRISVRFYLVAILFLLFDVEVVFFFPWAIVFKDFLAINNFIMVSMGIFAGVLLVGFYYVFRKGALEWD
jgi:NADH-quinone oxidoreductase subunit A